QPYWRVISRPVAPQPSIRPTPYVSSDGRGLGFPLHTHALSITPQLNGGKAMRVVFPVTSRSWLFNSFEEIDSATLVPNRSCFSSNSCGSVVQLAQTNPNWPVGDCHAEWYTAGIS